MKLLLNHFIAELAIEAFFDSLLKNFQTLKYITKAKLIIEIPDYEFDSYESYFKDLGFKVIVVSTYEAENETILEVEIFK